MEEIACFIIWSLSPRQVSNQRLYGIPPAKSAGTIPKEVGQWANVDEVWMNGNQLTGTIPSKFGWWAGQSGHRVALGEHKSVDPQKGKLIYPYIYIYREIYI